MFRRICCLVVSVLALSGLPMGLAAAPVGAAVGPGGSGDATVVAVIDSAITPYHWDYLASKMPQATNADPSDDLPLDQAPDTWLPGFPSTSAFTSYNRIDLTLDETDAKRDPATLDTQDTAKWNAVKPSAPGGLNYYWMPGTKVIGAMTFGEFDDAKIHGPTTEHGTGTTSVSVGNLHGTCPECLLVFLQYDTQKGAEQAINWAMRQPWIDAISNSYGFSYTDPARSRVYNGSDVAGQKSASVRGQTLFFSAGNGVENAFLFPNTTYFSSQEGPDWVVTVGAVSPKYDAEPILPDHASFTGHGKPADIAAIGDMYPSAYEAETVGGGEGYGFGGTSNATPVITGLYSRALYVARRDLAGASRAQSGGVIAQGGGFACSTTRSSCELADGQLTASELRTRLFHGAVHTSEGMSPGGLGPSLPPVGEDELLNEGHGSYLARGVGEQDWLTEFDRIIGPMEGRLPTLTRPAGEREWMRVDSWCRQHIWGPWQGGYFATGYTQLPPKNYAQWPVRSTIQTECANASAPPKLPYLLNLV